MLSKSHLGPAVLDTPVKSNASPVGGAHLTSLTLPGKPGSVVSFTSQCSYSSTLVHVGDKKTQPELGTVSATLLWVGKLLSSFYKGFVFFVRNKTFFKNNLY